MRLTCPNCGARYEVDDALIPPEGRDVQCSDCFTTWFQAGPRTAVAAPAVERAPFPAPSGGDIDIAESDGAEKTATDPAPTGDETPSAPDETTIDENPALDAATREEPKPDAAADADLEAALEAIEHEQDLVEEPPHDFPEKAETATQVVTENSHAEEESLAVSDDQPEDLAADGADGAYGAEAASADDAPQDPGPKREIDPGVRDILREEAEREARLRQAEAVPVETQSEMPLDEAPEDENRARRRAELEDAEDAFAVGAVSAAHANGSRKDLLPDIEEINSTLRASDDRQGEDGEDLALIARQAEATRRRGVRLGFLVTLALTAGLIWLYLNAETVGQTVPPVAGAVDGFVAQVDVARYWLDDLARGIAASGEGS